MNNLRTPDPDPKTETVTREEVRMKRGILFGFVTILSLLVLVPQYSLADEKPLMVAYRGDATTMDPHGRTESTNTMILNHIFTKLVTLGPNNEVEPELAKSWKNVDPNTWEFYLESILLMGSCILHKD